MKIYLHYDDNDKEELYKTLKITLPKSWKTGPLSKLLGQFVESYNASSLGETNPLKVEEMHLCMRYAKDESEGGGSELTPLASDAITVETIEDRDNVYVMHGPSQTLKEMNAAVEAEKEAKRKEEANLVQCTHFGCKKRFPRGGPYPECCFHKSPPVFHETAKFWSCCPQKKAYDWNDFEAIQGCQTGTCTEVKEEQKQFLGGTDLREQAGGSVKLKSIDDFNKAQAAGGAEAAPVLERLQRVMEDLGIEKELYDQVLEGMKKELEPTTASEAQLLESIATELGKKLKACMKSVAAEQLRIK